MATNTTRSTNATKITRYARVAFDVDSTLSGIEGIDELAKLRRVDVSQLTDQAMRGEILLEDVYARRLELVRPTIQMIALVGALYTEHRTPGAATLINDLYHNGVEVLLVSGALRQAILPLARSLRIPGSCVYAVDIYFDTRGRYAGFDETNPLARADGKRVLLEQLHHPRKPTVLVGDGSTDLAAAPAVDAFVAFTGVANRPQVVAASRHAARNFKELRTVLGLAR
ncbi:MAG: HAD-IB family phosphatase [Planctomycetota bacterium]